MEKRDETLGVITNLFGQCKEGLQGSSLFPEKGVYDLGRFEVMLTPILFRRGNQTFDFWEKGKKDQKFVRFSEDQRTLIIFEDENKIVFSDYVGLRINEYIKKYPNYPHFEFSWIGELIEGIPKGTLIFARVDLSGSDFVNYSFNFCSAGYNIYNPQNKDLHSLGFPENLEEADEILGVHFEKVIDFDKRKKEILKNSGLEELVQEIKNCT